MVTRTDGAPVRELDLPGIGTASGFGGKRTDAETFFLFSSYATPPSIYRFDLITGQTSLLRTAKADLSELLTISTSDILSVE